jgi:hypothetical protein
MSHWTTKLVGIRAPGAELDWLGPDADQVRSALGDGAVAWAINVGQRIATKITQELPPLGDTAPHFNAGSKIKVRFVELTDTIPVQGPETEVVGQAVCADFLALLTERDREVVVLLSSGITNLTDVAASM